MPASTLTNKNKLIIEAGRTELHYWKNLWRYRELFYFLSWRDILVRYKQTVIGVAWAVVRPVALMLVFTVVYSKLAKLPSNGAPYPLMVFAAMLPWQFFANALADSSNSLITNTGLISKVYFPRLIIPLSSLITSFIDFLISALFFAGLMIWYGILPGWRLIALPLFILIAGAASIGAGLWFTALNVRYRDFKHVIPFVVQVGLFISPVGFSSSIVPEEWRLLYSINPMVSVIDGFRWAILEGNAEIYWPGFIVSLMLIITLLLSGIRYFRKTEKTFADVI